MRRRAQRTALLTGAVVLILTAVSPAAWADVIVSPGQARQGDGVDLTFQVREDEPGAWTSAVQIVLPADAPVAEVYPLSVPDWTPKIEYGTAHVPPRAGSTHAHANGTTVTSAITWFRSGRPSTPGAPSELRVAMAPMPQADRLAFTVVQTYSDGRVRRWAAGSGPVLQLDPAAPVPTASAAAAAGHHAAPPVATGDGGWPVGLVLVAGVSAGLLIAAVVLGRRRRGSAEEAPLDAAPETLEPVGGGPDTGRAEG